MIDYVFRPTYTYTYKNNVNDSTYPLVPLGSIGSIARPHGVPRETRELVIIDVIISLRDVIEIIHLRDQIIAFIIRVINALTLWRTQTMFIYVYIKKRKNLTFNLAFSSFPLRLTITFSLVDVPVVVAFGGKNSEGLKDSQGNLGLQQGDKQKNDEKSFHWKVLFKMAGTNTQC